MADLTVVVDPGGTGDYLTLTAAEAGEQSAHHDLVGDGNSIFFNCVSGLDANVCSFSGWHANADHKITISTSLANRHTGKRGSGFRLVVDAAWGSVFECLIPYTTIDGLSFTNTSEYARYVTLNGWDTAGYMILKNCFITTNGNFEQSSMVQITGAVSSKVINNIIVGMAFGVVTEVCDPFYAYNNTFLNCGVGMSCDGWVNFYAKNNYAGASVTADYTARDEATYWHGTTNYGSDETLDSSLMSVADCHFVNSTLNSEDGAISAGSGLIGIGTDLRADAIYNVTTDIFGTTRAAVPCVGAYEYVAPVISFIPIVIII